MEYIKPRVRVFFTSLLPLATLSPRRSFSLPSVPPFPPLSPSHGAPEATGGRAAAAAAALGGGGSHGRDVREQGRFGVSGAHRAGGGGGTGIAAAAAGDDGGGITKEVEEGRW